MLFWGILIFIIIAITILFFMSMVIVAKRSDNRAKKIFSKSEVENNTYKN